MFGDMPEMPTSGGPSTSGGGPPVNNFGGGISDEKVSKSWQFTTSDGNKSPGNATYVAGEDGGDLCGAIKAIAEKQAKKRKRSRG